MARWVAEGGYRLVEWETDLSSQTGASQAGILLGSNEDIPAFRWVEKETGRIVTLLLAVGLRGDRAPPGDRDRPPAQRRGQSRQPALRRGGRDDPDGQPDRRREAREPGLPRVPCQRLQRHAHARPVLLGGRPGDRGLDPRRAARRAAPRAPRRQVPVPARGPLRVRARPHRLRRARRHDARAPGGVRDVLQLRRGRPPLRPGAGGHDGGAAQARPAVRPHRARAAATRPRPYEIVVLSDHGQTQGATFKQRHGYGLDELVERSLSDGRVASVGGGDEQAARVGQAVGEATGRSTEKPAKNEVGDRAVVVLGSGNLGLVYLMESDRRMTMEEIEARHPRLLEALRTHDHIGWLLVRSEEHGAVVLGPRGTRYLSDDRVEGDDPLTHLLADGGVAPAPHRRLPARGRHHDRVLLRPRPWTRAARSRSSSASTAAWAGRRRGPSSSCRPRSSLRPSRSSGPRPCTACSPAGARRSRTPISSGRARRARAPG